LELLVLLLLEISIFSSCNDRGREWGLLLRALDLSPERRERMGGVGMMGNEILKGIGHLRSFLDGVEMDRRIT
jgi:hypothetical protein